jgi:hypothetical protein
MKINQPLKSDKMAHQVFHACLNAIDTMESDPSIKTLATVKLIISLSVGLATAQCEQDQESFMTDLLGDIKTNFNLAKANITPVLSSTRPQ